MEKISTLKGQLPIVESPSQATPTDSHKGALQLWRSLCPRTEEQEPSKPALLFARLLCQLTVISPVNIPGRSPLNPPLLAQRVRKRGHWLLETGKRRWIQDIRVLWSISSFISAIASRRSGEVLWKFLEIYLAVPLTRPLWSQRYLVQDFCCLTADQEGRVWAQLSRRQILPESAPSWLLFTGDLGCSYPGNRGPHFLSREVVFLSSCLFHTRTQLGEIASTEEAD